MASTQTKPYRVVGVGAHYQKVTQTLNPEGETRVALVPTLALRGETIELVAFEADRLTALDAVKPADAELSYDEMSDQELEQETVSRGLDVRGSAADGQVRREDRINALTIHDQGSPVSADANVDSAPTHALATWISEQKPTVDDTVALAEGDPRKAEKVLEAERMATSGSPRVGVEQALQKLIDG